MIEKLRESWQTHREKRRQNQTERAAQKAENDRTGKTHGNAAPKDAYGQVRGGDINTPGV